MQELKVPRHFRYINYMLAKPITIKLEWKHSWKALGSNIIQVINFLMRTSYFTKIMHLFIIEIFEGCCEFIIPLLLCSSNLIIRLPREPIVIYYRFINMKHLFTSSIFFQRAMTTSLFVDYLSPTVPLLCPKHC